MISVRNLRRLLSGNKLIFIALCCAILSEGCGVFGPASGKTGDDQGTDVVKGTPNQPETNVDTVEWIIVPESEAPPITERSAINLAEHKDIYNVVLLAPFGARQLQSNIDRPSARMVRMIEFLAGLQYGIHYCLKDVNIRLKVIDTEQDPQFESNLDQIDDLKDADIILGPYYTNQVEAVSQFARREKKILISPWNTAELQSANPAYIQLRPSLKSHAKGLADFALSHFSKDEIMIITKNEPRDIEALAFFQKPLVDQISGEKLREVIIEDIGKSELTDSLTMYIQEQGYRSFIIPVWQDEPFVIATLSKLNFAKAEEYITVLGLPQWMEMSRMDFDYFQNLHVHLSSARPVSYTSKDAREFRTNYVDTYGDIPGADGYYGLDVIKWLGGLLNTEGVDIRSGLGNKISDLDQEFQFTAIFAEDGETVHHYENQKIQILRFAEYKFEQVD